MGGPPHSNKTYYVLEMVTGSLTRTGVAYLSSAQFAALRMSGHQCSSEKLGYEIVVVNWALNAWWQRETKAPGLFYASVGRNQMQRHIDQAWLEGLAKAIGRLEYETLTCQVLV